MCNKYGNTYNIRFTLDVPLIVAYNTRTVLSTEGVMLSSKLETGAFSVVRSLHDPPQQPSFYIAYIYYIMFYCILSLQWLDWGSLMFGSIALLYLEEVP